MDPPGPPASDRHEEARLALSQRLGFDVPRACVAGCLESEAALHAHWAAFRETAPDLDP